MIGYIVYRNKKGKIKQSILLDEVKDGYKIIKPKYRGIKTHTNKKITKIISFDKLIELKYML